MYNQAKPKIRKPTFPERENEAKKRLVGDEIRKKKKNQSKQRQENQQLKEKWDLGEEVDSPEESEPEVRFKDKTLNGSLMLNDPEGKIDSDTFVSEKIKPLLSSIRSEQIPEISSHTHQLTVINKRKTTLYSKIAEPRKREEGERESLISYRYGVDLA